MIETKTQKGETRVEMQGAFPEIVNDTLHILSGILSALKETPGPKEDIKQMAFMWKMAIAEHMMEIDEHTKKENIAYKEVTEADKTIFKGKLEDF